MESRRNGPQLSLRHDDDDDEPWCQKIDDQSVTAERYRLLAYATCKAALERQLNYYRVNSIASRKV